MTPLDLLAAAIRARASAPSSLAPPAAILWTDPASEWLGLLPAARRHIPELLVLGDYRPADRTGPAIWLRCVIDGSICLPSVPSNSIPIIYVPGIDPGRLRAGEECPETLRPLVELMYRGILWHHENGRDWSVRAFLTRPSSKSPPGPALDIARDAETGAALLRAVGEVAQTHLNELRGHRLDANDFNRLVGVNLIRDILRWMGDASATREAMAEKRWDAFRDEARRELGFDPETEADVEAGAKLAKGSGRWGDAWARFTEAPLQFPGVAELLRRSRPMGVLIPEYRDRWPDLNDEDEVAVLNALAELPNLPQPDARRKVQQLEADHGDRRGWVWAELGRSPLAQVLGSLARLATATEQSIGGASPDDIARVYADRGWQADRSAREALALATPEHEQLIARAVRHLMESWLGQSALALQGALRNHPLSTCRIGASGAVPPTAEAATETQVAIAAPSTDPVKAAEEECLLFVDGLRYEVGRCLADRLEEGNLKATVHSRWAANPTVTATAKPAVTPVADEIAGKDLGADFLPVFRGTGRPARASALRDAMTTRGYAIIGDDVLPLGPAPGKRGWRETGRIDYHGHHHGAVDLARLIDGELDRVGRRVRELLDAGWRAVRIVTDHGWLLLPGGLPMITLPRHLTASKWARCAVLAGESRPDAHLLHPWHWNANAHFASPPGIACFSQRPEYAHGGLSVQECLIPDIRVTRSTGADGSMGYDDARTVVRSVNWVRMRCNIEVEVPVTGATADLRLGTASGSSVASTPKAIDADGCASLIMADDTHADAALFIVVSGPDGCILAQRATRKGDPAA